MILLEKKARGHAAFPGTATEKHDRTEKIHGAQENHLIKCLNTAKNIRLVFLDNRTRHFMLEIRKCLKCLSDLIFVLSKSHNEKY